MRGELVEDAAAVAELLHRCASNYGPARAQRPDGPEFPRPAGATLGEFREGGRGQQAGGHPIHPAESNDRRPNLSRLLLKAASSFRT